ncbi:MAG: NDP-sugar synthase, partial [Rhodobacteraceae bacterium]|nr:NDP-sugar synthase [Paracoccaceae bacterium]
IEDRAPVYIVKLSGDLRHADTLHPLQNILARLRQKKASALAVSCAGVQRVSASGIAGFLDFLVADHPVAVSAYDLPRHLITRLNNHGLTTVLPIFKTLAATLQSDAFRQSSLTTTSAVILGAGTGQRLWPLTQSQCAPCLDIAGVPLVGRLQGHLSRYGIRTIFSNPGHFGDNLITAMRQHSGPMQSLFFTPNTGLSTAGQVLADLHQVHAAFEEDVLVANGNALVSIDLAELVHFHKNSGADMTIALSGSSTLMPANSRAGNQPDPAVCVIKPECLQGITDTACLSTIGDVSKSLTTLGAKIRVFRTAGKTLQVRTGHDFYTAVHAILTGALDGQAPSGQQIDETVWHHPTARVHSNTLFEGHIHIGAHSVVDKTAILKGCVSLGRRCKVDAHSYLRDSVVLDNTTLAQNALVDRQVANETWSFSHPFADGRSTRVLPLEPSMMSASQEPRIALGSA